MATRRVTNDEELRKKRAPSKTPEAREVQMISLATDLAEKQMREGTASSQVISHYLKLGTTRERLEQEKITHENELLKARKEAIESTKRTEELFKEALEAMRSYSGQDPIEEVPVD